MSELNTINNSDITFYDKIDWNLIAYNKMTRDDFLRIKSKIKKSYASLLGEQSALQFYMYKSLNYEEYTEIKKKNLDKYATQKAILSACLLWPKPELLTLNNMEAGIALTLVYQILTISFFISDPRAAMDMILEI